MEVERKKEKSIIRKHEKVEKMDKERTWREGKKGKISAGKGNKRELRRRREKNRNVELGKVIKSRNMER